MILITLISDQSCFFDCRYGHDHGGGYGKGGGGGYDEHRKVDNEGKVHWVGRREGGGGIIEEKRGEGEREYQIGSQEAEEYSRLGREAYRAGRRESGREADRDGEVYSAAQGPGYSYSHHNRRREEMKNEEESPDYHLSPPQYQPHHSTSGGEQLTPPQYEPYGGDSFPGYQPLAPSRR